MSWIPVAVHSRSELEKLFAERPMQLRPVLPSRPLRVGHPEFIGPFDPSGLERPGTIRFEPDGSAWLELPKDDRRLVGPKRPEIIGGNL